MYEGKFENGKPVSEWKRYYEGGQLKALIKYNEDSDTARVQLYEPSSAKVAEGCYVNEKKVGKWEYFTNDLKIAEENYLDGIKHGISRTYYPSGEILEQTNWQNGRKEGNYEVFFKNGKPYMQCKFSNDKRNGLYLTYFQNGRLEMEANYKDNLRDGEWRYYSEDGEYLYSLKYDEGQILNPEVRDSIGNLQLQDMEKDRNLILDPEKFMEDPSDYMMKININR
jgi:antitoxin component YwqK of YwqJK toxin-antitoxin module